MKAQYIDVGLAGAKTIQIKKVDQHYLDTPFHFHQSCELVLIETSYGKRIVGDRVDNFEVGDLVLMGPNLPHIWQNDEAFHREKTELRVKSTVVYFPPDFLLNLTDEQAVLHPVQELIKRAERGIHFYGDTSRTVADIMMSISEESGFKKIIQFLQVMELLSGSKEYDYLASVSYRNLYDEKDTGRINKVYQFLIQHFHRDIELQEVADLCNMTPNAFCRFFKSRTQKSFTRFLNELRIGHSCKLLQNEKYSIADVCFESGFNNMTNFNKFFKTILKTTPSEYRKRLK